MENNILENWPKHSNPEYQEFKVLLQGNNSSKSFPTLSTLLGSSTQERTINKVKKHSFYALLLKDQNFK